VQSDQAGRPPSFHHEYSDGWATWVLDNGLPDLPQALGEDDEVPIAYWAGPKFGAVLFRSWWSGGEEGSIDEERDVNDEHYAYVRTASGWEAIGGSGGSAGPERDPLRPRAHPDRLAYLGGEWLNGPVRGVTGSVGAAAQTIELVDQHGRTARRIEAPLGLVIVCFDALDEVMIRVLDAAGQHLLATSRARSLKECRSPIPSPLPPG
jgi:hypothetical protein